MFLPAARGNFHGLYIEMKRKAGGRVSADQKAWINALSKQGYAVRVCLGWEDAARTLEEYLQLGEFGKKQEVKQEVN